ncbi:MAG: Ribonuclease R [Firmicutes bacterium ADurb.Bin356]|nr:MAG: Ribonuclease R [Firmicutes bacterium ADurb.Bin356]
MHGHAFFLLDNNKPVNLTAPVDILVDITKGKQNMHDEIIAALKASGKPLTIEQLINSLEKGEDAKPAITELLNEHRILLTRKRRLALPEHLGLVFGRIQGHAAGFGFFLPKDGSRDAFVPVEAMHGAMHNDEVYVRYTAQLSRNGSPEACVMFIAKRALTRLVGTFEHDDSAGGYVVPDDARIPADMLIPRDKTKKAKAGDKVVAKIIDYPDGRRPMLGQVCEILGNKHTAGTDVLSIIRQYELPEAFSKAAQKGAKLTAQQVQNDERVTRENLLEKLVFTIDGPDAKDFDDALSLERLENGNLYLGVHIADVAHYVKEGGGLDKDALLRGTSVYLADRVIPMLPEELSNGICSLNPGEDRLALSCFMEIDSNARVLRHRLSETLICSKYRLVYGDVSALLAGDEAQRQKYADLVPVLSELEQLAAKLKERRHKRGSIDFDIAEADLELDETGRPTSLKRADRGVSESIIEECMLLANETVAEHMYDLKSPFLYRVHEQPESEKLLELNTFLQTLGYSIRNLKDVQPRNIQKVLYAAKDTKEENIINKVVLRAMQKARYSEKCLGHFGLAYTRYCHFTAPIRRYPDLFCHRIIKLMLHGGLNEKQTAKLNERLSAIAQSTSKSERTAMEAERAVEELKKCEYMKERIGESFAGIISGVVSFGFFAELDNTAEGLVRASTLDDDYYVHDEKNYRMVGRNSGKSYRLGDEVYVRVSAVDMVSHNIELELEDSGKPHKKGRG